jgi:competence protein ComEA
VQYIYRGSSNINNSSNNNNEPKKININTASKAELVTITGIGESTADKIINYREKTSKFKKIEDIKNVPGIGDAKFEAIKEQIST